MPKLPVLTPRKVVSKLKKLGFVEDHQTGSHRVFYHPDTGKRTVVPFHLKDLPKGTLAAILREADIDRSNFINA